MMPKLEELLIAYETYCAELAEEELAKLIAKSKDKESTSIQCTGFFQKHLATCGELVKSEYIGAAFTPNPATLAKSRIRRAQPTEEELAQAELDIATIKLYRKIFGLESVGGSLVRRTYPDWQTAIIDKFQTKDLYLKMVEPITNAQKKSIRTTKGIDSYLGLSLEFFEADESARQRVYDMASLVGRYKIRSELWEKEADEYKLRKEAQLNTALADPNRKTGFVHIGREGDLLHSHRFASIVKNSRGETITSKTGDLNPVLLVAHTCTKHLSNPSLVAVIYFGTRQQYKLRLMFQSKSTSSD
jgi:hypothetical protein